MGQRLNICLGYHKKLLQLLKKKKKELIVDIGKHSRIGGQKLRTCTKKVDMAMEKREAM